jgi:HK97 family phage major capsid protein
MDDLATLSTAVDAALEEMEAATTAIREAGDDADFDKLERAFRKAEVTHATADKKRALEEARRSLKVPPAIPSSTPLGGRVSVTGEPLTYERHAPWGFFSDMFQAAKGSPQARERLDAHRHEMEVEGRPAPIAGESRAAITQTMGEGGELIAPAYLQDKWVGLPRPSRPIANTFTKEKWLQTNSINLPKIKSGTTVAIQTDGGTVSSTAITTELVTHTAQTVAGSQDVSQQLVDLSLPGVDVVIFDDLTRALDTLIDSKCIEGTVTNAKGLNQVSGINTVTYTEASPKVKAFYSKVALAQLEVNKNVFLPPTVIAMHPSRWAWLLAASDTAERPLVVPVGAPGFNAIALQDKVAAENLVGTFQGLPVSADPNIATNKGAGTNQDEVFVYRGDEIYLWESTPVLRIFEQVLSAKLEVRIQSYVYYTLIAGRLPKSISVLQGTGLVAPSL